MTSRCQHGCGMGLTGTIGTERSCPTDSATLTLGPSENTAPPDSRFQLIPLPLHAGLNHSDRSIEPRPAGFLFPSPVPPPPLTFAEPEAACFSSSPVVLSNLVDNHAVPIDEFEAVDLVSRPELCLPPAPVQQSFESELASYAEFVKSGPIPFLEPEVATLEAAGQPHPSSRPWVTPATPAGIATMVLGILLVGPSSIMIQSSVAAKDHSALEQFSSAATAAPQPAMPESAPVMPAPSPTTAFRRAKSHVTIHASDRSWVVACADGKVLFARLFTVGNSRALEFNRRAIVRVGSAGSVQIVADGKSPGGLGAVGEVRIIEFTPGGSHFLKGGEIEDCTVGR